MTAPPNLAAALASEALLQLRTPGVPPPDRARRLDLARQALGAGLTAQAIPLLSAMARHLPGDAEVAKLHGVALRLEQRLGEAAAVFAAARAAGATDPMLLQGLAQTRYELGLPAAQLFAQAQHTMPGNPEILRNRAAAMADEGDPGGAEQLLEAALRGAPDWLDGHQALATLRWTNGDQARFADSYAAACAQQPGNAALWLAWFRALAQSRDWPAALAVLDQAEAAGGETPAILVARLFVASESGDSAATDHWLDRTAQIGGDTANLCRVRHFLRQHRPADAAALCLQQLTTPSAPLFWPYLSLAWRVLNDPRAQWLDRPEALIQPLAVDLTSGDYAELADVLRGLHVLQRPYIEQSVRGGTQTNRSVILRHEPIIRRTHAAWLAAIRSYVDGLPPFEQGHPLLGLPRGELLVEGSWSVRLLRQGYNVPHNHPAGWLSTAFYIALPDPAQLGPAPAGHIAFGTPPAELGLDLPAYCTIEPRVGRTAIFPSTMWHRTMPFEDGERLVLALDIRRPRH